MGYKSTCILLLLIATVTAYTDITMTNCPAQFEINKFNTTNDTTVASLGSLIYGGFTSQSDKDQVQEIVVKGDMSALSSYISKMMSPYIIFASIFFALYILTVLCCLFDRSCPPCESIRRDPDSNPYSSKQIRIMMVILLICASGSLIITIISFSFVPELKQNLDMADCSIYLALDTAINGDEKWAGFSNLQAKVLSITNLLPSAVTQIQSSLPAANYIWLIGQMQKMQTTNVNFYSKYKDSQLITPNPYTTQENINANISIPMINSSFILQGLGPNGTSGTMISDIDSGLRVTAKLSQQAYSIVQSANFIKQSLNTILNNSVAAQNTLKMYNNQLSISLTQYESFSQQYFHDNFGTALSVFQTFFGLVLLGSLVVLFGLTATHCFEVLGCRHMVNLGWTIYGFSYIGVIVITFFTLSVGSISYNFCNYFNQMLTVQVSYNKFGQAYTQNIFTRMDTCIFGNGNALSKFSISQEMGTVTKLFTNIQTYFDYTNTVSKNYVNPLISTSKISSWMNAVNNYKLGIYDDCSASITGDDNPKYALKSLNLYTYQGGGVTTGSRDVWVWDKTNCTDPTQTVYTAGPSYGTTLSLTNASCISLNQKIRNDFVNIWSFSDFIKRYVQIKTNYSNAYDFIKKYGETIINYRDSRINLFTAIYDDLSSLLGNNTSFNTKLSSFNSKAIQFYGLVSSLNNLITNSMDGLAVTANCNSVADKMRFVYNVYCINFQAQIIKIALCSLIMLGFMFLGIIAGSRFGMMYYQVQRVKKVEAPEEKKSENHITHLQMENSTARSEDSDD